jgi:serine/threonine protein phosphatase PrpC
VAISIQKRTEIDRIDLATPPGTTWTLPSVPANMRRVTQQLSTSTLPEQIAKTRVIAAGFTRPRWTPHNEDTWFSAPLPAEDAGTELVDLSHVGDAVFDRVVLGVFDGAGGWQAGDTCARLAATTVAGSLRTVSPRIGPMTYWIPSLIDALVAASSAVFQRAAADARVRGGSATAVVAVVVDGVLFLGHLGNCRAYLSRAGELSQLTVDHTIWNDPSAVHELGPERARALGNMPVRALGATEALEIRRADIQIHELRDGDVLLLCSDGLWEHVPERGIRAVLAGDASPSEMCRALDAACGDGDPRDDRSMVVARFRAPPPIAPRLPDRAEVLSAPEGDLSLSREDAGCFHQETREMRLSWSPSSAVLRTQDRERTLGPERARWLLGRVLSAAALPVPAAQTESTSHVSCRLSWSYRTHEGVSRSGHMEWTTSDVPRPPGSARHPVLELSSIAAYPLSMGERPGA